MKGYQHDSIIITPEDEVVTDKADDLRSALKQIYQWRLQSSKIIMNKKDYDDIVKWGKGV